MSFLLHAIPGWPLIAMLFRFFFRGRWWAWALLAFLVSPGAISEAVRAFEQAQVISNAPSLVDETTQPVRTIDIARLGETGGLGAAPISVQGALRVADGFEFEGYEASFFADPQASKFLVLLARDDAGLSYLRQLRDQRGTGAVVVSGRYLQRAQFVALYDQIDALLQPMAPPGYEIFAMQAVAPSVYDAPLAVRPADSEADKFKFVGIVMLLIAALPVLVAAIKLIRSVGARKRSAPAAAPISVPAAKNGPWGERSAQVAPQVSKARVGGLTRKNDGFDDSPIKSRKGWFF